jgi:hypothetical protein
LEDHKLYESILEEYKRLKDNNPGGAYSLNQRAKAHEGRIGELKEDFDKLQLDKEHYAESVKCRLSNTNNMRPTEGNRYACQQQEYINALEDYTTARKIFGYLKIWHKVLGDIAYQSYNIFDTANKKGGK